MDILLKNTTFIAWDTLDFRTGDLLVEEGPKGGIRWLKDDKELAEASRHETIDCSGKLVTKSFASGHHHVYSALARGMPPPPEPPADFREILKYIWWTLDQNLDEESIRYSALATAIAAARAGTTFVIDHHASPNHIAGSLDIIAKAFEEVGISHLLCYEVTDRGGKKKAEQGLRENERYLTLNQGLVGLHASFTVEPDTLAKAVDLMNRHQTGIHMHLAEDKYDQEHCLQTYYQQVTQRLNEAGVIDSPKTILVHGLHLDARERKMISKKPCWIAQNMESNLKNKVGAFSGKDLGDQIMLGTDGMHSDMIRSAKAAFFTGQLHDSIHFDSAYQRFRNVHRYLQSNDFRGDGDNNLVVLDYDSPTEVTKENFTGHFIFGLDASHVRDVISKGRILVKDREVQTVDAPAVLNQAQQHARRLWKKMGRL